MELDTTKEPLDIYLESIGGLTLAYREWKPAIKSASSFSCGPGWYPLIHKLIEDLVAIGWNREIIQVKEKFGGLRFYITDLPSEGFELIGKAQADSYHICEQCGQPGELRRDLSWVKTLCADHYNQLKK